MPIKQIENTNITINYRIEIWLPFQNLNVNQLPNFIGDI